MKLLAFLTIFNEVTKGNLVRCLKNCIRWADDIVVYDDASTDHSVDFCRRYTEHVIQGTENRWTKGQEMHNKAEQLEYALKAEPRLDHVARC